MSGYGSGRSEGSSGREVDPEWVAWAEEQTIRLLRAQERFTYLQPSAEAETIERERAAEPPPPPAEILDRDPIRVVNEIHLDDPAEQPFEGLSQEADRVVDLADGRRFVVRVHRDNV